MKKTLLRIMAALLTLMIGIGAAAAEKTEEEDPVVVRVGVYEYPLSLAKYALSSAQELAGMGILLSGGSAGDGSGDREKLIESVIDRIVRIGVLENKLTEDGLHSLTEEENAKVNSYTRETYQSIWEGFQQQLKANGYEADEQKIMEWLRKDLGFTMDVVYKEALAQVWIDRGLEAYCGDVTITPAEVYDYLMKNYVEPDREAYENNIPRYEEEILTAGNESFYTPEGYRIIRQIQLDFPEEIVRKWKEGKMKAAHFADICRVDLLYRHGGVWMDATCYMDAPFPEWLWEADFFVYQGGDTLKGAYGGIQNCFIRGAKDAYLLKVWREIILAYWKEEDSPLDYFVHQLLFCLALDANPCAAALYAKMPSLVQDPTHVLWYEYADRPYDEDRLHAICAEALFQKLNYKTPSASNPVPGSFADHILAPYR